MNYNGRLIDALLRYVRALDGWDQELALTKVWAALESLVGVENARYDALVRRCSFLLENLDYHKQLLEHFRET